jgi:molybdopterin-guanine dinucleotide biosynthesis protein A
MTRPFDGVVLTGGRALRLGGRDKPMITIGGRSLLDRVLAALTAAEHVIVVGPDPVERRPVVQTRVVQTRVVQTRVVQTREDPPGGGPVAALATGLAAVVVPQVVTLAGDLPFVTPGTVATLVDSLTGAVAAIGTDASGRDQPLLAAYDVAALAAALPAEAAGTSLRALVARLEEHGPVVRVRLEGTPPPWWDCDTDEDVATARAWAGEQP